MSKIDLIEQHQFTYMNKLGNKIKYGTIYNKQQYYDNTVFKRISTGVKIFRKMC